MEYVVIEVPKMNDSMLRIIMDKKVYYIRFSYNDTNDYWTFGLYDQSRKPICIGMKIVPNVPINLFSPIIKDTGLVFAAYSLKDRIGYDDFWNDNAKFLYFTA